MTTHADRVAQIPVSSRRLWAGMLVAPTAWVLTEAVGYYLAARSCEPGTPGVPLEGTAHPAATQGLLALAALIVSAAGLATAFANWVVLRTSGAYNGSPEWERARFMAFGGILLSVVFLAGIVFFGLPAFLVSACSQARLS